MAKRERDMLALFYLRHAFGFNTFSVTRMCSDRQRVGLRPLQRCRLVARHAHKYKKGLTKAPTSLLECAVYISARKKLIHAMPLNTDRPISRAKLVGCAISATRNYLKSHGPKTLNPLFCINRAKTLKLCTHSRSPLFEFPKSSNSYKSP
jgi:hypothetical protein